MRWKVSGYRMAMYVHGLTMKQGVDIAGEWTYVGGWLRWKSCWPGWPRPVSQRRGGSKRYMAISPAAWTHQTARAWRASRHHVIGFEDFDIAASAPRN
jgi:hypothetical protein